MVTLLRKEQDNFTAVPAKAGERKKLNKLIDNRNFMKVLLFLGQLFDGNMNWPRRQVSRRIFLTPRLIPGIILIFLAAQHLTEMHHQRALVGFVPYRP